MRFIETTHFWNEDHFFLERVQNTLTYADLLVIAEAEDSHSEKVHRPFKVPALLDSLPADLQKRVIFLPVDLRVLKGESFEKRDAFERDAAFQFLKMNRLVEKSDLVLVQDFDEFLLPEAKAEIFRYFSSPLRIWRNYIHPKYYCTYYHLNTWIAAPRSARDWSLPVIFRAGYGWDESFSPHILRNRKSRKVSKNYWGWHHSYLGSVEQIQEKLKSFSHADDAMVRKVDEASFLKRRAALQDLFGRDMQFEAFDDYSKIGVPALKGRVDLFFNKKGPSEI